MNTSDLAEDASLQTVAEGRHQAVNDDNTADGELFSLSSLPPGYVFCLSDVELVIYYLKKKLDNEQLPANKIVELNVYDQDPNTLAERYEPSGNNEWFYFTPRRRKHRNGQRPNRSVGDGDGYWKATSGDKDIKFKGRKVGCRKALVFYRKGPTNPVKTHWIMQEYRVAESVEPPRRTHADDMKLDDCVLCRIYRTDLPRISKRSWHESGPDESASGNQIFRFDLNADPEEDLD